VIDVVDKVCIDCVLKKSCQMSSTLRHFISCVYFNILSTLMSDQKGELISFIIKYRMLAGWRYVVYRDASNNCTKISSCISTHPLEVLAIMTIDVYEPLSKQTSTATMIYCQK
jgi:hypothetical protein